MGGGGAKTLRLFTLYEAPSVRSQPRNAIRWSPSRPVYFLAGISIVLPAFVVWREPNRESSRPVNWRFAGLRIRGTYETLLVAAWRAKSAQQSVTKLRDTIRESLVEIAIAWSRASKEPREREPVVGNWAANIPLPGQRRKLNSPQDEFSRTKCYPPSELPKPVKEKFLPVQILKGEEGGGENDSED